MPSRIRFCGLCALCVLAGHPAVDAQDVPAPRTTRLAILMAEDRRAPAPRDLATIRAGTRSGDPETAAVAVRALGRLERPALVPDILPSLKHELPEVRAEAANALGQALGGAAGADIPAATIDGVLNALIARLNVETESSVRGAIYETLGRVPSRVDEIQRVDNVLVTAAAHEGTIDGRLGLAGGLEALVRLHRRQYPPSDGAIATLRSMAATTPPNGRLPPDPLRDVRVRRLALEALIAAGGAESPGSAGSNAGIDRATLDHAADDPDPQVRRLAMRAAGASTFPVDTLTRGLTDSAAMVRIDALRAMRVRGRDVICPGAVIATGDSDVQVVLVALDELAICGASADAVAILRHVVDDLSDAGKPRAWHRAAHALVSLANAAPERGAAALGQFTGSRIWQLRMYAARAAAILKDRTALEKLADDQDDNVREAAVEGLVKIAAHDADAVYVRQLMRNGHQVLRAAAAALAGTPTPGAAAPALRACYQRLVAEGHDNSHDVRAAIEKTLQSVGADPRGGPGRTRGSAPTASRQTNGVGDLDPDDLRRLAAARARVTIRDVGIFELVLFPQEAPATVLRFARLAESGYYNGLTFHRVVPNFVIQGGSPGASEYIGDAMFMRDEVGRWPHVRGAVGVSTRGRDTGDAQIFVDLVDNPRLNHNYTVFAQILTGVEVIDQILEGDVIERIEITTSSSF
jgi:cyclophilin family peptidyl-prolyl cis-trans isomerase/HEAT repeat protein